MHFYLTREVLREENGGFETVEEKEKQTRWKM
jgi:hypothetical protein